MSNDVKLFVKQCQHLSALVSNVSTDRSRYRTIDKRPAALRRRPPEAVLKGARVSFFFGAILNWMKNQLQEQRRL
jgi:hypothetical protein